MTITVYLPDAEAAPEKAVLAPSPSSLAGLRIAVLDNGKPNAAFVMTAAAKHLAARTGAVLTLVTKKGPLGLSANAAIPMAADRFDRILAEADIVITGTADCGSCTAYSVHDAIALEQAGKPAVVMTTTQFEQVSQTLAKSFGLPDSRLLVLPHPFGGTDEATLDEWAKGATDTLLALFTSGRTNVSA
jgi:hypothetical protein